MFRISHSMLLLQLESLHGLLGSEGVELGGLLLSAAQVLQLRHLLSDGHGASHLHTDYHPDLVSKKVFVKWFRVSASIFTQRSFQSRLTFSILIRRVQELLARSFGRKYLENNHF